jgi:hypothetical protein
MKKPSVDIDWSLFFKVMIVATLLHMGFATGVMVRSSVAFYTAPDSSQSLQHFFAFPGTEIIEMVRPALVGKTQERRSFASPSLPSRLAQHLGVGLLVGFLVATLSSIIRKKYLAPLEPHIPVEQSTESPHPFLLKSLLKPKYFSGLFLLHIGLMQMHAVNLASNFSVGPSAPEQNRPLFDRFVDVLCSYPLGAWFALEKIAGLNQGKTVDSLTWYLAGFISPICALLVLESLRIHLMNHRFPRVLSPFERRIQRLVHTGASVSTLLFVFQLWFAFSGLMSKSEQRVVRKSEPQQLISVVSPPSSRPESAPAQFARDTITPESEPWQSNHYPPQQIATLPKPSLHAPLSVRPIPVTSAQLSRCEYEQAQLDRMERNEVISEISQSWGALRMKPDQIIEMLPFQLRPRPGEKFDPFPDVLERFRSCHILRLASFGPLASATSDDIASFITDKALGGTAIQALARIGTPSVSFFESFGTQITELIRKSPSFQNNFFKNLDLGLVEGI